MIILMHFSGILSSAITRVTLPLEAHGTKYELISLELSTRFNLCFDWLWPSLHSLGDVNRLLDHSTRAG